MTPESDPRIARNSGKDKIEEKHRDLLEAACARQGAKHCLFDCSGCADAHISAAIAQANALDVAGVGVEGLRVVGARRVVETDFERFAGFGVRQIEQSVPGRARDPRRPRPEPESIRGRSRPGIAAGARNRRRPGNRK